MPLCNSLKGECWSGSEVAKTYDRAGPSESCLTKGFMQKCNVSDDVECVGKANTNFVYEIKGDSLFYSTVKPRD